MWTSTCRLACRESVLTVSSYANQIEIKISKKLLVNNVFAEIWFRLWESIFVLRLKGAQKSGFTTLYTLAVQLLLLHKVMLINFN